MFSCVSASVLFSFSFCLSLFFFSLFSFSLSLVMAPFLSVCVLFIFTACTSKTECDRAKPRKNKTKPKASGRSKKISMCERGKNLRRTSAPPAGQCFDAVQVLTYYFVPFQTYALKLLSWIEESRYTNECDVMWPIFILLAVLIVVSAIGLALSVFAVVRMCRSYRWVRQTLIECESERRLGPKMRWVCYE